MQYSCEYGMRISLHLLYLSTQLLETGSEKAPRASRPAVTARALWANASRVLAFGRWGIEGGEYSSHTFRVAAKKFGLTTRSKGAPIWPIHGSQRR